MSRKKTISFKSKPKTTKQKIKNGRKRCHLTLKSWAVIIKTRK